MLAEVLIAEHLGRQIGELHEEAQLIMESLDYSIQHQREYVAFLRIVNIDAFSINASLGEEVWRQQRAAPPKDRQHMSMKPGSFI